MERGIAILDIRLLSEYHAALADEERSLDEADLAAAENPIRYTEEEIFDRLRSQLHKQPTP